MPTGWTVGKLTYKQRGMNMPEQQKYTLSVRDFSVDNKPKLNRFRYPGVTLRVGPSDLTGDTIATIAVFNSLNRKTGNTIQVYNMPVSESPIEAVKTGADASVCGDCALRPINSPNKENQILTMTMTCHKHHIRGKDGSDKQR